MKAFLNWQAIDPAEKPSYEAWYRVNHISHDDIFEVEDGHWEEEVLWTNIDFVRSDGTRLAAGFTRSYIVPLITKKFSREDWL